MAARYRFTHALLHEVVYQNLLLARRTELHETAGRALEAASPAPHPERLSDLEALGHHWSLSRGQACAAPATSLAAGDWARAVYANDDAIRHYERALAHAGRVRRSWRPSRRGAARERLADLLGLTGRRAEALAHYESVQQEIGVIRRSRGGRRACCARSAACTGRRATASGPRACFAAGLERLGEDGDPLERAHLFQEMGRLAFRAGDNAGALELGRARPRGGGERGGCGARSRARARGRGDARPGLQHAGRGARADWAASTEAVEQIEQSIGAGRGARSAAGRLPRVHQPGSALRSLDPQRSIETCLRGLETAKKVGDLGFQSRLYANLAVAYCALTNRCEAEGIEAARAAIDLDRRLGLLDHLAVPLIVLGQIHQCHGDHAEAFASYQEALDLAEQAGEPQLLFPCYDGLATLHLDTGNQALAEKYLAKAQAVCERAGLEPDTLMVLPFLC